MGHNALFSERQLANWLRARLSEALQSADSVPPARLLNVGETELVEELLEEYKAVPPKLQMEHRYTTGAQDTSISIRGDRLRTAYYGQHELKGTRVEVRIPFEGDAELFRFQPSRFSGRFPRGRVEAQEVLIWWEAPADSVDSKQFHRMLEEEIARVSKYLEWVSADCEHFNQHELEPKVKQALSQRKAKVLKDRDLEADLQIPLRRRPDPSPVLEVPVKPRKKVTAVSPKGETLAETPSTEYHISSTDYADILSVARSWRDLVERLPHTFHPMPEEFFRDVLLVVLNNQFGPAGGEVFSRKGKTDILIWHDTGAVFIAECKFWSGSKGLSKAVDQLLGYLVWRDTKSALILLIREQDVTSVLAKTETAITQHPRYKRRSDDISGFPVYIFHQEGDQHREIQMALVAVAITTAGGGCRGNTSSGGVS